MGLKAGSRQEQKTALLSYKGTPTVVIILVVYCSVCIEI